MPAGRCTDPLEQSVCMIVMVNAVERDVMVYVFAFVMVP